MLEDFHFALRQLRKSPAYTAILVLILTLGIGANTAVFSVMDAILMRRLPVSRPDGLYYVHVASPSNEVLPFGYTYNNDNLPLGVFEALRRRGEVFEELIAYAPLHSGNGLSVRHGPTLELAKATEVSGNFFSGLGVRLEQGRGFTLQDERAHAPLAVLSYDYWTRSYARNPGVLGQTLYVKGVPITVVGIADRGFNGVFPPGGATDFWVPFQVRPELNAWGDSADQGSLYGTANFASLRLMARLRPGITPEKAQQATAGFFREAILQIAGKLDPTIGQPLLGFVPVRGIEDSDVGFAKSLWILMGLVFLVLLIACTNVALMMQARNLYREREFSLRVALGANKATIFRQLFAESAMLVSTGAILGWLFAILATTLLAAGFDIQTGLGPNRAVLLFTLIVSCLAAIVFGFAPLRNAVTPPIAGVLRLRAHSVTPSRNYVLKGHLMLIGQIAGSLTLLMASSLLVRTLRNYATEDLGMEADRVLVFDVSAPQSSNPFAFYSTLLERIRKCPGVESASMAQTRLGQGRGFVCEECTIDLDGVRQKKSRIVANLVAPGYLRTMGIPVLAGREFSQQDNRNSPPIVMIDETLYNIYFGSGNAIGHKIGMVDTNYAGSIVGVMRTSKYFAVGESKVPEMYFAAAQFPPLAEMNIQVRARGDAMALIPSLRRIVAELNPDIPIVRPMTQRSQFDESYRSQRIFAILGSFFGLLAALLVAAGVYGMHSFHVSRTQEIGVRMAFGASHSNVLAMVLQENVRVLAIGLAIGTPLTFLVARLLESMLYRVSPFDWLSFAFAATAISVVSVVASIGPARRAASVVPMQALRTE